MRVMMIGGTGFIGRYAVRELIESNHEVAIVHRGRTPLAAEGCVAEFIGERSFLDGMRGQLAAWSPDVVVDFILGSAAQAAVTLDVFRGVARRLVAISSGDVYQAMAVLQRLESGPIEPIPLTEDSRLRAPGPTYSPETLAKVRSTYSWVDDDYDKVRVEQALRSDPALPATILRLPMVYGPGDPLHRFFPALKRIIDGRPAILFEERYARFVPCRGYVENVAHAIVLAATREEATGRTYNVADPFQFTEAEWTEKIGNALGWQGRVVTLPREHVPKHLLLPYNFAQHLFMDSTRIRAELGYREVIALKVAIGLTIEWEQANPPQRIDPSQFDYSAEDEALERASV